MYLGESAPTNDKICDDFLLVIKRISSIRRQYASSSAPFVTPDDFLSEKNLSDTNLARKRNVAETQRWTISFKYMDADRQSRLQDST